MELHETSEQTSDVHSITRAKTRRTKKRKKKQHGCKKGDNLEVRVLQKAGAGGADVYGEMPYGLKEKGCEGM